MSNSSNFDHRVNSALSVRAKNKVKIASELPFSIPDGPERLFGVLGIGNAIVDRLAYSQDSDIEKLGMAKGAMTLVDREKALDIEGQIIEKGLKFSQVSGGSAANTMAGLANLGIRAAFVGSVSDDSIGSHFIDDLRQIGVTCIGMEPLEAKAHGSGICHVLVTPDAERSMATYLGAASEVIYSEHLENAINSSSILYLEGYLFDSPVAKETLFKAIDTAKKSGTIVAISLSDPFVVERYRHELSEIVFGGLADIVFANSDETQILAGAQSFDEALKAFMKDSLLAALTAGSKGAVVISKGEKYNIDSTVVDRVIDTTGAGDLFAAGFLAGLLLGESLHKAGSLGSLSAAEVISLLGARPPATLMDMAVERGLI